MQTPKLGSNLLLTTTRLSRTESYKSSLLTPEQRKLLAVLALPSTSQVAMQPRGGIEDKSGVKEPDETNSIKLWQSLRDFKATRVAAGAFAAVPSASIACNLLALSRR